MVELKLAKLPDRTPVKITIAVSPALKANLDSYAEAYNQTYRDREPEPVAELIPYMLQAFLESDKVFMRARKQKTGEDRNIAENRRTPARFRPNIATTP
ncbi:MAG: DUF2274 domain-containing protein [Rhodospirillaceae bacterium]|nr:DUF2274 domain-containing protein [Rhodospirillaceae bacterium]